MKHAGLFVLGLMCLLVCACHQPRGRMTGFILPGAKDIKVSEGKGQLVTTHVTHPGPPADKQSQGRSDERESLPLQDEMHFISYTIRLTSPAEKQLRSLADEREWHPLKTNFMETSSTLSTSSDLFTWQTADISKNEERKTWAGQWQNAKGEILMIGAIYDPSKTTHGKVDVNVKVVILSPGQAQILRKKAQEL